MLGLAWFVMVCMGWVNFLPSSLAYQLVPQLSLTPSQLTLIFTAPVLMCALFNIPGGMLGDRYGIRLIVGTGAILNAVSTVARFWVSDFSGMFFLSCVFGIGLGIAFPNLSKLVSVWFPPKQSGLASGIYITALTFGNAVGLATGAYFEGWRSAFLYVGILSTVSAFLWIRFCRSISRIVQLEIMSPFKGIQAAAKNRNIWLLIIALSFFVGGLMSISGNLPEALSITYSISPQKAGAIASLFLLSGIIGNILLPLISDKLGLRKPFIYAGAITTALFVYLAWKFAPGIDTYILISIGGFMFGCIIPLLLTIPIEMPDIRQEHIGGAVGLITGLGNLGGFFIPILVITPIMSTRTPGAYNTGFLVIVLFIAAISLAALALAETGTRATTRVKSVSRS
jgi:nitrate/nitrite transporter NarK